MSLAFASDIESDLLALEEEERKNLEEYKRNHPEEFSEFQSFVASENLSIEKPGVWRSEYQRWMRALQQKRYRKRKKAQQELAKKQGMYIAEGDGRSLRKKLVSVKAVRIAKKV